MTAARLAARVAARLRWAPDRWLRPLDEPRFHLASLEDWRRKAGYLAALAEPTARDWELVRLPRWLD